MDDDKPRRSVSPYLLRPLRTLAEATGQAARQNGEGAPPASIDRARRDQAGDAPTSGRRARRAGRAPAPQGIIDAGRTGVHREFCSHVLSNGPESPQR